MRYVKSYVISIFISVLLCSYAEAADGWYVLKWGMSHQEAQLALGRELSGGTTVYDFEIDGDYYKVDCSFEESGLYKVTLRQSDTSHTPLVEYYKRLLSGLTKKYGKVNPSASNGNMTIYRYRVLVYRWNSGSTQIMLTYSHSDDTVIYTAGNPNWLKLEYSKSGSTSGSKL